MRRNPSPDTIPLLPDLAEELIGEVGSGAGAIQADRPSRFAGGKCREAIEKAVIQLLEQTRTPGERRLSPRVPYVRLAWVFLGQTEAAGQAEVSSFPVVTTDLSFEGVGVLCWQEIPLGQVVLQLCGSRFACEVRWSRRLTSQVSRYGLRFLDVLDMSREADL